MTILLLAILEFENAVLRDLAEACREHASWYAQEYLTKRCSSAIIAKEQLLTTWLAPFRPGHLLNGTAMLIYKLKKRCTMMMTPKSFSATHRAALPFLCLLALVLSLCLSPANGDTGPGDWWMFQHDPQHTGLSPFTGPSLPGQKWIFPTEGAIFSSPAIGAEGTIYVGSSDGNLYAINPDGTKQWAFATGGNAVLSPAIGMDGTIYVTSVDGNLYAINQDGTQKWTYPNSYSIDYSPTIGEDGTIYFCVNGYTGDVVASPQDPHQILSYFYGVLYAINPNGIVKWSFYSNKNADIYTENSNICTSAAIGADGTIYVGATGYLYAINPNGTPKWSFPTGNYIPSDPAIGADGSIYVGFGGNLYAINPDCTLKWSIPIERTSSPAIGADGTLYVGSFDANLYAINGSAPGITSFNPTNAVTTKIVTITGFNFTGVTAVSFGGTAAVSFSVINSTTITTAVPAVSISGHISVTTADGTATSTGYFYMPPTIASFTPTSAGAGTLVTITGTNFTGATAVSFGGTAAATFSVTNATTISATVASGTISGTISVTTPGGTASSTGVFTISAPIITSFTPTYGGVGTVVTITGAKFIGATAVAFGGTPAAAFSVTKATTISATVSNTGSTGVVSVTTPGGTASSTGVFTISAPIITSFTPTYGGAGTVVTITGANFIGASAVNFNGTPATSFSVTNATTIKATVASGTTTGTISVTTLGGMATSTQTYYYLPSIASVTPTSGPVGTTVIITGANFNGATAVAFGGTAAVTFSVTSATTISATVSNTGSTGVVSVTTPCGTPTSSSTFT